MGSKKRYQKSRARKRKSDFHGNQYTPARCDQSSATNVSGEVQAETPVSSGPTNVENNMSSSLVMASSTDAEPCTSAKKLRLVDREESETDLAKQEYGYLVVSMDFLSQLVNSIGHCPECRNSVVSLL